MNLHLDYLLQFKQKGVCSKRMAARKGECMFDEWRIKNSRQKLPFGHLAMRRIASLYAPGEMRKFTAYDIKLLTPLVADKVHN